MGNQQMFQHNLKKLSGKECPVLIQLSVTCDLV